MLSTYGPPILRWLHEKVRAFEEYLHNCRLTLGDYCPCLDCGWASDEAA